MKINFLLVASKSPFNSNFGIEGYLCFLQINLSIEDYQRPMWRILHLIHNHNKDIIAIVSYKRIGNGKNI